MTMTDRIEQSDPDDVAVRRADRRVLDQLEGGELVGMLLCGGDRVHARERTGNRAKCQY